jgi:hypothetical protein
MGGGLTGDRTITIKKTDNARLTTRRCFRATTVAEESIKNYILCVCVCSL